METRKSSKSKQENEIVINTGHQLTIETISDFARLLSDGLAKNSTVVVEFEPDLEVDITAIQVLCSTCKAAISQEKKFTHRGPLPQSLLDLLVAAGAQHRKHCTNDSTLCFHNLGGE